MKPVSHVIVMTTVETKAQAISLAEVIMNARLAACVQCLPIHSIYRWKGKVVSGHEHLLLCKTRSKAAIPLQSLIRSHHAYELPEIITIPISAGLPGYLHWITSETQIPLASPPRRKVKSLTFPRQVTKSAGAKKHSTS